MPRPIVSGCKRQKWRQDVTGIGDASEQIKKVPWVFPVLPGFRDCHGMAATARTRINGDDHQDDRRPDPRARRRSPAPGRRRSSISCWCPEAVRRQIQMRIGQEMTFHVTEYLEGNSGGSRFVPRRIGFNYRGRAGVLRSVLHRGEDRREEGAQGDGPAGQGDRRRHQPAGRAWLSTLPGIGATTAEQIVTTLKRKVRSSP